MGFQITSKFQLKSFLLFLSIGVGWFISLAAGDVYAATRATLPKATVDTTYSLPTGNAYYPKTGSELQTAINNASLNDVIYLDPDITYTAPSAAGFVLKNKASGSGWIYIVSDEIASLSKGTRVSPSDATHMPTLRPSSSESSAVVVSTEASAHHYRFVGLNISASGNFHWNLMLLGLDTDGDPTYTHHIIVDRCYIHGDSSAGGVRGVELDASHGAVIDSYISDFKAVGYDSQAIWAFNTTGPLKIVNNYLEAAGENIMFGGEDNAGADYIPQDITIQRNYFYKPMSWQGSSWQVKNLFEIKMAIRVLIEGNIFENAWDQAHGGQQDHAIVLKSTNQSGGYGEWSEMRDVTFRYNKVTNVGIAFGIADQPEGPCVPASKINIHDNLIIINTSLGAGNLMFNQLLDDMIFNHNTVIGGADEFLYMFLLSGVKDGFDWLNNIFVNGNGAHCDDGGNHEAAVDAAYKSWSFQKNALVGASSGKWPTTASSNFFPSSMSNIDFVNYTGGGDGDYHLASDSPYKKAGTDGKDLGADIDAIEAATAGASQAPASQAPASQAPAGPTNLRVIHDQ